MIKTIGTTAVAVSNAAKANQRTMGNECNARRSRWKRVLDNPRIAFRLIVSRENCRSSDVVVGYTIPLIVRVLNLLIL